MSKDTNKFSYFDSPIENLIPRALATIDQVHLGIKKPYFKSQTELLRSAATKDQANKIKCTQLPYVTFSGTFSSRRDNGLITRSRYFCLDLDHLGEQWQAVWENLIDRINPVLLFRSPSGDGIKCVLIIDPAVKHEQYFQSFERHFVGTLGVRIDQNCKNISRACFLCHDPNAYYNESARIYGISFIASFELPKDRPRLRLPIATTRTKPERERCENTDSEKVLEVFNKMCAWADQRAPYRVGTRHKHKLTVFCALQRQGVPIGAAVALLYARCIKSGVETRPIEQFQEQAERVYSLYKI